MPHVVVDPRRTVSFEEFCTWYGPAVALDGYVEGEPRTAAQHATFDHHGDVRRVELPATCEQVLAAIHRTHPVIAPQRGEVRDGLDIYVNDCDPDVAFSVWALEHPDAVEADDVVALYRLEGRIDTHGGMCADVDPAALDALCWVTEPWAERFTEIPLLGRSEMTEIIDAIGERLGAFAAGHAGATSRAAASFELVREHAGIWVIRETHPLGRCVAAAAGARLVVVERAGPTRGTRTISVCGRPGVDLRTSWDRLNSLEGLDGEGNDRWGGCDTIGGSPRASGTRLDDDTLLNALRADG